MGCQAGVKEKPAGSRSARVRCSGSALGPGERMGMSGAANSWMVWRQAPQGEQGAALRLVMARARMRIVATSSG